MRKPYAGVDFWCPGAMSASFDIDGIITNHKRLEAQSLRVPFDYLQSLPGTNNKIRYRLLTAFNEIFFQISDTKVISAIAEIVDIFHGSSLLVDDIEDDSTLRRGQPCAHTVFGVASTLNTGNMMYFVAMQKALELPAMIAPGDLAELISRDRIAQILVEELLNLHSGQGLEILWRDSLPELMKSGLPSIHDYLQMAMHKTGGLFRLSVEILQICADLGNSIDRLSEEKSKGLLTLANLLGIIYQIRDDYLNLVDERYAEMKGFAGEDLIEGKLSLPVLFALLNSEDVAPLTAIFIDLRSPKERRAHPARLAAAREFIATSGALNYTYNLLQEYVAKAKACIASEPPSELAELLTLMGKVVAPR